MIAILDQHDDFVYISGAESEAMELAHMFMEAKMCVDWQGGGSLLLMGRHSTSLRNQHCMEIHSLIGRGIIH